MTPLELRALAKLRSRGQAPRLAVFVMDDWAWATRLTDDIGALTIRVKNARDHEHDWSPVAGLWVYLLLRNSAPADVADFSAKLLSFNPAKLTVSTRSAPAVDVWDADADVDLNPAPSVPVAQRSRVAYARRSA